MAKKTMIFGKAALTAIRLTNGTRANIPAGRAVPESIDPDDLKRLLAEDFLVEVELLDDGVVALDPDDVQPEGPNPPSTPMARPVGLTHDDVEAAKAAELARAAAAGEPIDDEAELEGEAFTDEQLAEVAAGNVDDTLDAVGDDPVKAQQVLDAELKRPTEGNGKQRTTLIAGLQDVLDAAAADDEEDES